MMVTDTILMAGHSDQVVYVLRSNYTEKEILPHIRDLVMENKLSGVNLILNGVLPEHMPYGGKYKAGYVYSANSLIPWHKRLWNKINTLKG